MKTFSFVANVMVLFLSHALFGIKYWRKHCAQNFFREELLEINDHLKWMLNGRLESKQKIKKLSWIQEIFHSYTYIFHQEQCQDTFLCVFFCYHSNNITFVNKKMLKTSTLAWMARLLRDNFYIEISPLKSVLWSSYETFLVNLFYRHYFNCIDLFQSCFKSMLVEHKLCCIGLDCLIENLKSNKRKKWNQLLIFV